MVSRGWYDLRTHSRRKIKVIFIDDSRMLLIDDIMERLI